MNRSTPRVLLLGSIVAAAAYQSYRDSYAPTAPAMQVAHPVAERPYKINCYVDPDFLPLATQYMPRPDDTLFTFYVHVNGMNVDIDSTFVAADGKMLKRDSSEGPFVGSKGAKWDASPHDIGKLLSRLNASLRACAEETRIVVAKPLGKTA